MRVGDPLRQHHDDRITADVGSSPSYLRLPTPAALRQDGASPPSCTGLRP